MMRRHLLLGLVLAGLTQQALPEAKPISEIGMMPTAAGMLRDWITASRDAALAAGTEPIPENVRQALSGHIPEDVLEKVRWAEAGQDAITLQTIFYFGHTPAITLDYVIVFSNATAMQDEKLWAHELVHVMQFDSWGIEEFARRYVSDYQTVESEASEFRWQWMKNTGRLPAVPQ